ncbi:MAG: hypothetical protein ABEK17_01775 [Candidatus Aenigmatarchaeota archaeon]
MESNNKAQTAFEYMMVMGIAMALLVPLLTYVNSQTSGIKSDLRRNSLQDSLDSITEASEMVWTQGSPAKMTIEMRVPADVNNITVENDVVIAEYEVRGNINNLISTSEAPLVGNLPTNPGTHYVSVEAEDSYVNISY